MTWVSVSTTHATYLNLLGTCLSLGIAEGLGCSGTRLIVVPWLLQNLPGQSVHESNNVTNMQNQQVSQAFLGRAHHPIT